MKTYIMEQAAEDYADKWNDSQNQFKLSSCFIAGVLWQRQKSYTEEQVISLLDRFGDHIDEWYSNGFNTESEITEKWFHKNKNNIK